MALAFEIDSIETVDEGLRAFYVEHGGKYRLDVSGIDPADELKEALRKEREDRKAAANRARELEEAQAQAAKAQAEQKGEFETLWKREQEERKRILAEFDGYKSQISEKSLDEAAFNLALELTKDVKRARLLAKEARPFAKMTEDGVVFEQGGIKIEPSKLAETLKADYPFLVDGNQSSGGGAAGSTSGAAAKEISRKAFEALNAGQRMTFVKSGGKITD